MYVHTDAEKFLEKYETIWTKIECFIKLNHLSIYADRYVKTKIIINGDKFYTNFRDLNVPEDDIEYESFIAILFIIYLSSKANSRYIFLRMIFLAQNVSMPTNQNLSITLDQNVGIIFVSNLYFWNIGRNWHRKLYIRT